MWDELNEPLGFGPSALAAPSACQRATARAVAGLAALAAAIGITALARHDTPIDRDAPLGGEPFAVATIEMAPAPPKPAPKQGPPAARDAATPPIASAGQTEGPSGVKVTRGSGGPPSALIIDVARALAAGAAPLAGEPPPGPPAPSNP